MSKKTNQPVVTEIHPITQQIGGHILAALQKEDDTVAVLTSIVSGLGPDSVVSIPISRFQFMQIQAFLQQEQLQQNPETPDEKPIGFELPNQGQEE